MPDALINEIKSETSLVPSRISQTGSATLDLQPSSLQAESTLQYASKVK